MIRKSLFAFTGLLSLFAAQTSFATTTAIWSLDSGSSQTWNPDPYFGAQSNDPIGPAYGESVSFIGTHHPGTSTQVLPGGATLIARWRISYSEPVYVLTASFSGLGDWASGSGAVFRILNWQRQPIATQSLTGINTNQLTTLRAPASTVSKGTVFYVDIYGYSWDATYISAVNMTVNALAGQCAIR